MERSADRLRAGNNSNMGMGRKRGVRLTAFFLFVSLIFMFRMQASALPDEEAHLLFVTATDADDVSLPALTDNRYDTVSSFEAGDTLTIRSDEEIASLMIEWDVGCQTTGSVSVAGQSVSVGENGFLHEYVELPVPDQSVVLTVSEGCQIAGIRAYSPGTLPSDVQRWSVPDTPADLLAYATHADDELLYLGGVLATYAGERGLRVQVAYLIDFTEDAPVREHEKLDGLWAVGVTRYPVNGPFFRDVYSETFEAAAATYDYDEVLYAVTQNIRRFRPQVLVTQDFQGEYGHGAHKLLARAVSEALDLAADASYAPGMEGAPYAVPKTYYHLYGENKIDLDMQTPLAFADGKSALELVSYAFTLHKSQAWTGFYVTDTREGAHRNIADFGLYRSLVGEDTGNDMMEHLVPYDEQERLQAEEEKRLAEEQAREEAARQAAEQEALAAETNDTEETENTAEDEASHLSPLSRTLLIAALLVFVVIIIPLTIRMTVRQADAKRRRRRQQRKNG